GCVKSGDSSCLPVLPHTGAEQSIGGHECYVVGSGSKAILFCQTDSLPRLPFHHRLSAAADCSLAACVRACAQARTYSARASPTRAPWLSSTRRRASL